MRHRRRVFVEQRPFNLEYETPPEPRRRAWWVWRTVWAFLAAVCAVMAIAALRATKWRLDQRPDRAFFVLVSIIGLVALMNAVFRANKVTDNPAAQRTARAERSL